MTSPDDLPVGLVRDDSPPFVPRMVMTPQLLAVLKNVVSQWRRREHFAGLLQYGIRPLDRLLFFGPPGNGKTLACYWMAKELNVTMYRVVCNQLRLSAMGGMTRSLAAVVDFLNARPQPAICLWDEVESIFVDRASAGGECEREVASALTVFLQALDRWKAPTLIVMATNLPSQLDPALLSRVEMKLEFGGPNAQQCETLLEYWAELLCKNGSSEWAPALLELVKERPPVSFRELQQTISWAARDWVAARSA